MDPELLAYLDDRFQEASRQVEGLRAEIGQRLERLESSIWCTQAAVEDLRAELPLMAKAAIVTNDKLDSFRADVAWQFHDARVVIRRLLWELNRRVGPLESWRERTERDPIELVRERFGKTPDKTSG
jgi:hypothetical protein